MGTDSAKVPQSMSRFHREPRTLTQDPDCHTDGSLSHDFNSKRSSHFQRCSRRPKQGLWPASNSYNVPRIDIMATITPRPLPCILFLELRSSDRIHFSEIIAFDHLVLTPAFLHHHLFWLSTQHSTVASRSSTQATSIIVTCTVCRVFG